MEVNAIDELVVPLHKRLFASYLDAGDGSRALHLNFGEDEIVFDEPALFGFGEGLAAHARFFAADAATWGSGTPWPRVQELLAQLLDAGLLRPAACAGPDAPRGAVRVPSPLPVSPCNTARDWRDCEAITHELAGRRLPLGWLELVVPVYRVAHPVVDAEGRQVGEANVFPAPLRLNVETEWRTCQHAGSRWQDPQPMNVSSLRSMLAHWKPAMALLARLRAEFLRRSPHGPEGWTVGRMQRFTSFVLAVPAYLLMKADGPVANGALDPMLSSLFRVVDGVRMVMHRMLFTSDHEAARPPAAPVDAAAIYAYAERNTAFLSDHGVCAGPKLMIEELLRVLCDGLPGDGCGVPLGVQAEAALAEIDRAFAYAMLGLRAYATVFSLWPPMARTCERLAAVLEHDAPAELQPLRERLQVRLQYLHTATRIRDEARRTTMEAAYADMHLECGRALGLPCGLGDSLPALLTPRSAGDVHALLAALPDPRLADVLAPWFGHEQQVVRVAAAIQAGINAVLGRPAPGRLLTAADLALHYRLVAYHYAAGELHDQGGRLPSLDDDLAEVLGLQVQVDANAIRICEAAIAA